MMLVPMMWEFPDDKVKLHRYLIDKAQSNKHILMICFDCLHAIGSGHQGTWITNQNKGIYSLSHLLVNLIN